MSDVAPAEALPVNGTVDSSTIPASDTPADDTKNTDDLSGLKSAIAKERELRKKAESRVKELTPYEQKVRQSEEANKSEATKAAEALVAEKAHRVRAETALMRHQIAADKGVPAKLAPFLSGDTQEEIEAAADVLMAELSKSAPQTPGIPGRPTERMVTGQPSTTALDSMDPTELLRLARDDNPLRR